MMPNWVDETERVQTRMGHSSGRNVRAEADLDAAWYNARPERCLNLQLFLRVAGRGPDDQAFAIPRALEPILIDSDVSSRRGRALELGHDDVCQSLMLEARGEGQICLHRRDTRPCDSVEALLYTAGDCFGNTSRSDGSELALCKIDNGWLSELGRFVGWARHVCTDHRDQVVVLSV
jgi:hypothetical protein